MLKPIKTPVKEQDGTFVIFTPDKNHIVYQTLYCCPKCINVAVGGFAIGETIHCNVPKVDKCPVCEEAMDWEAIDADEAESKNKFDVWFNANAIDGSLVMINKEGTGYLQTHGEVTNE